MNPYGQAGWTSQGSSSQYPTISPSIYGALPSSGGGSSSSDDYLLTFHFACNPTITNAVVTGPNNRTYFHIIDNQCCAGQCPVNVGHDLAKNGLNRSIA
ncbi:hypothetical protein PM082_021632 [Marasmius tenuissimus]|nr:hypothetical protein PM082_021632 [Marasmius tenuissimus]